MTLDDVVALRRAVGIADDQVIADLEELTPEDLLTLERVIRSDLELAAHDTIAARNRRARNRAANTGAAPPRPQPRPRVDGGRTYA